jgi:hypothetical protein
MRRVYSLAALLAAVSFTAAAHVPALSQPSPSPAPIPSASPAAPAPPAATDTLLPKARAEFDAWQSGKIDLSRYVAEAAAIFTPDFVTKLSDQYLKPLGAVKSFTQLRSETVQGATLYFYRAVCDKGSIDQAISWNDAGKVQYIRFIPLP